MRKAVIDSPAQAMWLARERGNELKYAQIGVVLEVAPQLIVQSIDQFVPVAQFAALRPYRNN